MNSFYIELSSNSRYLEKDISIRDDKIHPFNTIGNFRNKIDLLHPLEGDWEVGIVEISYTKSWKNLRNSCILSLENNFRNISSELSAITIGYFPEGTDERLGVVRSGYYETIQDLCKEINEEMKAFKNEVSKLPEFCFDSITKRVLLKFGKKDNSHVLPNLSEELLQLLGFDFYSLNKPLFNSTEDFTKKFILPQRPADITGGIHSLFVYCNLVKPQYIGDIRAKLLKTVAIPNNTKYGDQIVISYETPHYVPIIINDFEDIEIDIKDDSNHKIKFMFGRTRIKLHFRKCHIQSITKDRQVLE